MRSLGHCAFVLVFWGVSAWFSGHCSAADTLFVTEYNPGYVYKFESDGSRSTFATGLSEAGGLAIDSSGNVFVSECWTNTIYKYTPNGSRSVFASGLNYPRALAFDSYGNLFEADPRSSSINKFTPDGSRTTFASMNSPNLGLAFDSHGDLFASSYSFPGTIYKFTPDGSRSTFVSGLANLPCGLAFDCNDNLFVSNPETSSIYKITPSGSISTFATGLHDPIGLAFDSEGNLFVADAIQEINFHGGNILKFTPDGNYTTFATGLHIPYALAISSNPIPEPSPLILLGIGAIGLLGFLGRRRGLSRRTVIGLIVIGVVLPAIVAQADTFGTGANQFTVDFISISGATNPSSGISAGTGFTFTGVATDYRIGIYEITNDQWNKFKASYGAVTGWQGGYSNSSYFTGTTVPTGSVSWYEAAQFVNWLNTSTGNQPAYKFTGAPHTGDYTFAPWTSGDPGYNASNPYRNTAAKYFLPSEDEWVKAAYWDGTTLQTYATKAGESLVQGDGVSGTGWNYYDGGYATDPYGPWAVGSGSQELNGTYDMMGNNVEWMESPYISDDFGAGSSRGLRGGGWYYSSYNLAASSRYCNTPPTLDYNYIGFRVASVVPEPGSLAMLLAGVVSLLACAWRRHRA